MKEKKKRKITNDSNQKQGCRRGRKQKIRKIKRDIIDEIYPEHLKAAEITDFLADLKSKAFTDLQENDLLITSDTIVWFKEKAISTFVAIGQHISLFKIAVR